MARARDLISSLNNVTSSRDDFSPTTVLASGCYLGTPLCPILSSQPLIGDDLHLAHNGFSVRNKKYHRDTSHSYNAIYAKTFTLKKVAPLK